jgi:hypothetical protein
MSRKRTVQVAIVIHWPPIQSSMSLPHVTAIFIVFLTLPSCSSTPRPDIIFHEGPEGGVSLEFLADRNLRVAQPIKTGPRVSGSHTQWHPGWRAQDRSPDALLQQC